MNGHHEPTTIDTVCTARVFCGITSHSLGFVVTSDCQHSVATAHAYACWTVRGLQMMTESTRKLPSM